jgi:23S rRNA A1618 N6-methylase RlmF
MEDIDEKNIKFAKQNVLANDLKAKIRLMQMKADDHLIPFDMLGIERWDISFMLRPHHISFFSKWPTNSANRDKFATSAEVCVLIYRQHGLYNV